MSATPLRPASAAPAMILTAALAAAAVAILIAAPAQRWLAIACIVGAVAVGLFAADRLAGAGRAAQRALGHIVEQADRLTRGEALSNADPVAIDAVASLEKVGERVKQMVEARAHILATERDLDRARRMYRSILPLASVATHGAIRVAGQCNPAAETGGDWWTYRKLSGGRMLVAVGDATGHGVYSAMIGCAAHGAVEALSNVGEDQLTPLSVVTAINAAIRIPGADRAAMSVFAALFDPARGVVDFANASHMFPFVAGTDDTGAIKTVGAMGGQQLPVDDNDDSEIQAAGIRAGSHRLTPGDAIVLFTDGLVERRDKQGREFGYRRLQQALQGGKLGTGDTGIAGLRDGVMAKVDAFAAGVAADDDVTLVVCSLDRA